MSESHGTSNGDRTAAGPLFRLARSGFGSVKAVVRGWAWSSLAVWIAIAVLALAAYLVHRRGGYGRLGGALDSVLVTVAKVLDPADTGTSAPSTLLGRLEHALIHRLTRGAVARRRGADGVSVVPGPHED